MEALRAVQANVAAFLHPSRAADVPHGVHEILNSLLLRYNEDLEGVILAYLAPELVGRTAKILSGLQPYFHVKVTAKLLLFSPAPGMKIEGKVNKIEKDYMGVLVLGFFNTTIGVDDIRDDLQFSTAHQSGRAWISELDNRHTIELGSLIRFTVKSLQETEHLLDICGSLIEDNTGSVAFLDRHFSRSKRKRSKEGKLRSTEDEEAKHEESEVRREDDVQELNEQPQQPMNETVRADTEEALILPENNKKRRLESG